MKPSAQQAEQIWILSQSRRGDLNQMIDLAETVGAPYAVVKVPASATHKTAHEFTSRVSGRPAPRVVISAERAVTNLTLALKKEGEGRIRAVSIGRPGGDIDAFDLVVTSPHFRVKPSPNVLELATPLHRLDEAAMKAAAATLRQDLEGLPRPFTVALVGGSSGVERLNARAASALAEGLARRVALTGGSLLLATSPRTSPAATRALVERLAGVGRTYLWASDMPDNPYRGLLALADEFVVTSDSASMPIEAALTGRPVYLYWLPRRRTLRERALEAAHGARRWIPPLDAMFQRGAIEARADRRLLFEPLVARGVLKTFAPDAAAWTPTPLQSSLDQAAAAVRALL